jgi:hypothetical protein
MSSSRSSSRQHVESDATDPNSACWSGSTAISEIVVAPSATATARSTNTRPGSCRAATGAARPTPPTAQQTGRHRLHRLGRDRRGGHGRLRDGGARRGDELARLLCFLAIVGGIVGMKILN